ncbi:MAG: site-specific integrase [Legionellales bacterium]|nr:site-specific integrase [Legionellales bacterium]
MNEIVLTPLFDSLQFFTRHPENIPSLAQFYRREFQLALDFLHAYRGSEATFNAYRRDLERLLQWAWVIRQQSILTLKRSDIEAFIEFCQHPPLSWITAKHVSRFIDDAGNRLPNPQWRPFVASISKVEARQGLQANITQYQFSQKALQALFAVLSSFYQFLIQEDAITANPVAQIRQKSKFIRKQHAQSPIRRLSELQWIYVIETAEKLAHDNPQQHERTLFIMNALYSLYLRISELAASARWQPTMGDFYQDSDQHWWFKTVGKGNKERSIVVSDAMLAALKRYRQSLGLPPYPSIAENTPLLFKQRGGGGPITSTRQIRSIVQYCFDCSIEQLRADGFIDDANQLTAATVHWLRHTGISEDVKIRPREHVRDDAGHGSSAITDKYIDVERRARHASGKHKIVNPNAEPTK